MIQKEAKLIKKIKKGHQQAFRQLYDQYADYALRTAYCLTKSHSDASDVVQEAFVKVYRNIDSFDIHRPFKPWFYRILINECRRFLSKSSQKETAVDSNDLLDYLHQKKHHSTPSYDNIEMALDRLHEQHRIVVTLKYLNNFTEAEIAEMLETNISTVKSRLYKARQKLKLIWEEVNQNE
ncbi:RNA polymerase sigma factor [Aliibacillus thermotolerans]|uniref:RNA polymerase sigma factor n=1 Tax=Aliibacillus thermotolerans TaxID=1834418 RepID=A0ABW0U3G2_9BACI|nr:RNA polymerase sigma factor [Aliibacillus thermotolerans]MDA3129096.1 sigma-70 family RNA polymerase sigma factor [Aliibacillus thermotolerans]